MKINNDANHSHLFRTRFAVHLSLHSRSFVCVVASCVTDLHPDVSYISSPDISSHVGVCQHHYCSVHATPDHTYGRNGPYHGPSLFRCMLPLAAYHVARTACCYVMAGMFG